MDQDATWYGGRPRPRRHCVRWGLSSPHGKGTATPPLLSGRCLLWPNGRPSQQLLSCCCPLFIVRQFIDLFVVAVACRLTGHYKNVRFLLNVWPQWNPPFGILHFVSQRIHGVKWHHRRLWSHYDICVVGKHCILCCLHRSLLPVVWNTFSGHACTMDHARWYSLVRLCALSEEREVKSWRFVVLFS